MHKQNTLPENRVQHSTYNNTLLLRKYSAITPSSPDPACSHMTQYSSQTGLGEPGALSKHLQDVAYVTILALTRILTLLLLIALFFPAVTAAADISVEAALNSSHFPINQTSILSVTVNGNSNARPEMPKGTGLHISYQGQSSQMQWINGKSSHTITFTFAVRGTQPGKHTIDPVIVFVDGKKYTTKPVKCTVLPAASGQTTPGKRGGQAVAPSSSTRLQPHEVTENGFMQIVPAKNTAYVGEHIPVTINALLRQGVRWEGLNSQPRLTNGNFILESIDEEPVQGSEVINGVSYTKVSWNGTLSAIKQGSFPITVEIDATLLEQVQGQRRGGSFGSSPFNDPFFNNFFGGYSRRNVTLVSPELTLTVQGLPESGKPEDFAGAIGTFSLGVSAQPTTVQVGDPITLKMKIQGTGNFDRVHAPKFPDDNAWKTYEPSTATTDDNATSTKLFEQAIMPVDPQLQEIPKLSFSFFDPKQKSYITLHSDPIPITLQGSSNSTIKRQQPAPQPAGSGQKNEEASSERPPLPPIHSEFGKGIQILRPLYTKPWFQLMLALSLIFISTAIVLLIRRKRHNADPVRFAKKSLLKELTQLTTEAAQALEEGNSKQFLLLCRLIIQKRFGFSLQLEPQAISAADLAGQLPPDSPLIAILEQAEHAAYTSAETTRQEMVQILTSIQEDLKQI